MSFPRSVVLGLLLLGHLAKEVLDAPDGGIELLHGFSLGLRDVGEAFFLLYLFPQGFERLEARCSQAGFALGRGQSLLSVAMWASILAMACVRRPVSSDEFTALTVLMRASASLMSP